MFATGSKIGFLIFFFFLNFSILSCNYHGFTFQENEMLFGPSFKCDSSNPDNGIILNDFNFDHGNHKQVHWLDLDGVGEISRGFKPTDFYQKTSIIRFTVKLPQNLAHLDNPASFKFFLFDCTMFDESKNAPIFSENDHLIKIINLELTIGPKFLGYKAQLFCGGVGGGGLAIINPSEIKLFDTINSKSEFSQILKSHLVQISFLINFDGSYKIYLNGETSEKDGGLASWPFNTNNLIADFRACFIGFQFNTTTHSTKNHRVNENFKLVNLFVSTDGVCQDELVQNRELLRSSDNFPLMRNHRT